MRKYPAIAVIEFNSIADGIYCTDVLLKKAPIAMIKTGTVSRGRFLVIFGGTTASVHESLTEALTAGGASVADYVFLPDVHEKVHDALMGKRTPCQQDAIAILETDTVSSNVRAAEAAVKGTEVRLVELRLADYEMSGKAISVYNADLPEIQAAIDIATTFLRNRKESVRHRIISRPHETLTEQLDDGTRFNDARVRELDGEEAS